MINLNKISKSRMLLQNPYAHIEELDPDYFNAPVDKPITTKSLNKIYLSKKTLGNTQIKINSNYPNLKDMRNPYAFAPDSVITHKKKNNLNIYKRQPQPEQVARNIQKELWQNRDREKTINPIDILDPSIAFGAIGYEFNEVPTLDNYSNNSDLAIAGMIDTFNQEVYISDQFSPEVQRFTAAHELGHALMHQGVGLHRDRAVDGSKIGKRDRREKEADKFAVHFLMPKKLVVEYFVQIFGTDSFSLNDDIAFSLDPEDMVNIMKNKHDIDFISRILAETESYNNQYFISLSKQFRVSVDTMLIRLQELKLISI